MHIPTDITQKIGLESIFSNGQIRQTTPNSSIVNLGELPANNFADELYSLMEPPPENIIEKSDKEQPVSNFGKTEKASFSFRDFIDIINPLQHIPIVSTIYRNVTHDEIKAPARILGGGLFGGIIGAVAGLINSISDKLTGKDIGDHVVALFQGEGSIPRQLETVASNDSVISEKPLYVSMATNDITNEIKMKAFESYKNIHKFEIENQSEKIVRPELDLYL